MATQRGPAPLLPHRTIAARSATVRGRPCSPQERGVRRLAHTPAHWWAGSGLPLLQRNRIFCSYSSPPFARPVGPNRPSPSAPGFAVQIGNLSPSPVNSLSFVRSHYAARLIITYIGLSLNRLYTIQMGESIHSREYKIIIQKLINVRLHSGITQVQVAAKLKKPQSYVSKIERRERRLDVVELKQLLRIYKKGLKEFF